MANDVYANGREIACKAANGKSIAAFPDVCLSPPSPPAGPVPIPYPNTAFATDTSNGSTSVKISGKEVMLRDKSVFKKSTGDEAATRSFGANVITHALTGKASFVVWSMDVKIEGQNAVRSLDMTVHNHQSKPPGTPPWLYADRLAFDTSNGQVCKDAEQAAEDKCKDAKPHKDGGLDCSAAEGCEEAKACILKPKKDDKKFCCRPNNTGHHLVEVHCFSKVGQRGDLLTGMAQPGKEAYDDNAAPCVCASRSRADGTHGVLHAVQGQIEAAFDQKPVIQTWPGEGPKNRSTGAREDAVSKWKYKDARFAGVAAHKIAFPHCNAACIEKQLDEYHKDKCGLKDETPLRTDPQAATRSAGEPSGKQKEMLQEAVDAVSKVTKSKPKKL